MAQKSNPWLCTLVSVPEVPQDGERSLGLIRPVITPIKDSNIALLGSKLDIETKKAAAQGELAFKNAGKEAGLQVWRIVNFKLQAQTDFQGQFFSGDSYIVLHTQKVVKANAPPVLSWNIYFWLGATTSQDEAGTAAYKTVELDDVLDQKPVQHREVAGHESEAFLALFAPFGGLRILEGGAESGFNIVKPETFRPRLLQIKGRRFPRVKEVPLGRESLNSGDVFILDMGTTLFQWSGKDSSAKERGRGSQLTRCISSERKSRAVVKVEDEGKESDDFWKALPGGKGAIKSASQGGVDDAEETGPGAETRALYKLSDESGKITFTKLQQGNLDRTLITSKDAFVVDAGQEIFVWLGKGASAQEKALAPKFAMEYIQSNNKPAWLPLSVVREGAANQTFEATFDKNSLVRELNFEPDPQPKQESTMEVGESREFHF